MAVHLALPSRRSARARAVLYRHLLWLRGVAVGCVLLAMLAGAAQASLHIVRPGETLSHIARTYGTTVDLLVMLNDIRNPNRIKVGDEIVVTAEPAVYIVRTGDTLSHIAKRFGMRTEDLASINGIVNPHRLYPGDELLVAGDTREYRVVGGDTLSQIARRYGVTTESLIAVNHLDRPDLIHKGQKLIIPPTGGGMMERTVSSRLLQTASVFDRWPLEGVVSSGFGARSGRTHEGIDIAAAYGSPVRAVASGRVVYSDWAGTYGQLVKIDHGSGVETRYAHASRLLVRPGDTVRKGQIIARVGSTGRSTGPHLHFEIRLHGEAVNPIDRLPPK